MKLSKKELFVLSSFIEYTTLEQKVSPLNIEGMKVMSKLYSKIGANLLNINAKDIYQGCEDNLLKTVKYSK
tara:strand:+ start:1503 stop:1715 length:213 start_codon:yes stop_codon:yes gene_type:complete